MFGQKDQELATRPTFRPKGQGGEMNVHSPMSRLVPEPGQIRFEIPNGMARVEFCTAIGRASAAIGDETFYDRLLEVMASLVDADQLSLVRYSTSGAPDLIIPREIRAEVAAP